MNTFTIQGIALAIGLSVSAGAIAQQLSKEDYKIGKDAIAAEYKNAKTGCGTMSGNANDICVVGAKGKQNVALADLEARYKPSRKNRHDLSVAMADADYALAKEKCDDAAGNTKDVCVKEAKAAATAAKADAKAQMKSADANATAKEKTVEARKDASEKSTAAKKTAASDKLDADYAVAKEKCAALAGTAKESCFADAKRRFAP